LFYADVLPPSTFFGSPGTTTFHAVQVPEQVSYKWLSSDTIIVVDSGISTSVSGSLLQQLGLLEITSAVDGYKDYVVVNTGVNNGGALHSINALSPNPSSGNVMVSYTIDPNSLVSNAELRIYTVSNPQQVVTVPVNWSGNNQTINVSSLIPSLYMVSLVVDNVVCDTKALFVE